MMPRPRSIVLAALLGSAVGLAACGSSSHSSPAASSGVVRIAYRNYAAHPEDLTVKVGTTLVWTNDDAGVDHNVTSEGQSVEHLASASLATGQSFSVKLNTPGVIDYECTFHPFMTGRITVVE
jgi:plastocyanin